MSKKVHILPSLWVLLVFMCLVACERVSEAERVQIDSLNALAYEAKYRSLEEASKYVDEVLTKYAHSGYQDGLQEAWLNKGDVYGMRMAYDSAQYCYKKVLAESDNDLLCSVADVDMMSICLMTSMSKEFYDYRSDAHERFYNVEEAFEDMTEHQRKVWNSVQTEYHFVSVNYFNKVRQDEGVREEFKWLDEHQDIFVSDTTQWAAYLFLKALLGSQEGAANDAGEEMQRNLLRLLSVSRQKDYVYFEASALNSLAKVMVSGNEMKPSRQVFLREQLGHGYEEGDLALLLAQRALNLAYQYGNSFVATTVLVTLSEYYLQRGQDSLAVAQMERALTLINENHYQQRRGNSEEKLYAYAHTDDSLSTEMRWIADQTVVAVPEWMAMVREQLSIVYGALGMKAESDYNHNIYFDILDAARQDLRVQQEEENLKQEESVLNILLWFFIVAIVLLAWLLYEYNRRSRARYRQKVEKLRQVIDLCKKLPSVLLDDVEDEEDLAAALHTVADQEVEALFPQLKGEDWTQEDMSQMKGWDKEMLSVLQVFYHWMRQKGLQYLQMAERQRVLESETYVNEKHLHDNKRQYIEKLTSMSIVNGITPFLDRALHEVRKQKGGRDASSALLHDRLQYLSELIDKINEYNDVLGHWVKIRQGMVTLQVENFALQPLFDTLKRGTKTFEAKRLALTVEDTNSVVKADKALTLFMMNTLLDNARKYTPEGGEVTLFAEETDRYVEVSVKDTGHGMSAEDVDTLNNSKVYDSAKIGAEGAHASDIRRNKGFGFGLMNCKGIIGKYKKTNAMFDVCEFGVESEVGKGSRFFFRLPKGVLKVLAILLMLWGGVDAMFAASVPPVTSRAHLIKAHELSDSIFAANVSGHYNQAVLFADSAICCLNRHVAENYADTLHQMKLGGGDMAELEWWKRGYDTDYELIISIRNEVAIAALSLNQSNLYHYNNEAFTRLYQLTSTDPTLEEYCDDIRMANRNKKTTIIMLGVLILGVLAVYFFLHYRNNLLIIFNLRQFIQLNNSVFTSSETDLLKKLHRGLSDIKPVATVGMMIPSKEEPGRFQFFFTGNTDERSLYENMMQEACTSGQEKVSSNQRFHAYPLDVAGVEDHQPAGALGVSFIDGKLSDEETLIMRLVVQFMSIHSYFSYHKVNEMNESLELKQDECQRIVGELQKVHVRNQIMDNSLSTLKHETMYYPHRIKQLVDAALSSPESSMNDALISDIDELLTYYKEIFTILSACAAKQVELVLFKRTQVSAAKIGDMTMRSFKRQAGKCASSSKLLVSKAAGVVVMGDVIFLQTLVDNIISLFFEHHSGGDLQLDFAVSDGFAKFAFTDTAYRYAEEDIARLFYADHVKYDPKTDTLSGAQYLICRQIVREHDAYSPRRGCRIYVENTADGQGSTFVFTLPAIQI